MNTKQSILEIVDKFIEDYKALWLENNKLQKRAEQAIAMLEQANKVLHDENVALRGALKMADNALNSVLKQAKVRGYPTAGEWAEIEAIIKYTMDDLKPLWIAESDMHPSFGDME